MTITPVNGPVITSVQTANGLSQLATNTWLVIKGTNLVPANTPAGGANWSNAPDFANGQMPTQLGGISVMVNAAPAYSYFYCSAATDPSCASDQINVLAPLLGTGSISSPSTVTVTSNGVTSAPFLALKSHSSQAFLTFDLVGHVAAVHLDGTLVGPTSLYPGASTPAKPGEIISVYGVGFGNPMSGTIVAGSATQTGPLTSIFCWVGGLTANSVGALISPGLYQINITIPNTVPSGDNLLNCLYNVQPTYGGALIAVQ
jgi:uncharacterized protein (TIGR03437 family)